MLNNLYVDLVGNFTLVFSWTKDKVNDVRWTLVGEDPISGQPFVLSGGPHAEFRLAASEAWRLICDGRWFNIRPALEGLPPVEALWRRAFGPNFSDIINGVASGKVEVSGVVWVKYQDRDERERSLRS